MNSYSPCNIYRIGVDFDLTIVDSLWPWVEDFNQYLHTFEKIRGKPHAKPITRECYASFRGQHLGTLMNERQAHLDPEDHYDTMLFWRKKDLYDNMKPLAGAREFFENFKKVFLAMNEGHFNDVEFVCVTKCEPEHEHSKRRFIPSHFGDLFSGFVSTDDKHLVAMDCLIDDNPKYVKPCNDNGIFQIYVPQGHVEMFSHGAGFCEEYLTVAPDPEHENHFSFLNAHVREIADILMRHYNYVH